MFPSREQVKKGVHNPKRAISYFLKPAYRKGSVALTSRVHVGTHILERDWDLCIILDTCRVDALREVAEEYDFIEDVNWVLSVGGSSPEWMVHTFDTQWRETLQNTAYLTSNAWTEKVLEDRLQPTDRYSNFQILKVLRRFGSWEFVHPDELGRLEKIWRYIPEDERTTEKHDPAGLMQGGAPPRYVTERAISVGREFEFDRILLHYMQPHAPYMANVIDEGRDPYEYEKNPFDYLQESDQWSEVWDAYLDELRYVLDDVAILLRNIDAETVVISADHGEALGEYGIYNHHTGSLHPWIRRVPWMVTSSTDTESYSPQIEPQERDGTSVDNNLKALGYKS